MIDDPKLRKLYNLTRLYQIFSIYSYKDEIWKHIPDYPNYNISNYGRVKNLNYCKSNKEKIMKPFINSNTYLRIGLSCNSKRKNFLIHLLVLKSFNVVKNNNDDTVDHININYFWNHISNLRYATKKEQVENQKKRDLMK